MTMLVDCSYCRTPLQLPPATNSIRCAVCFQITYIATSVDHNLNPPNPHFSSFNHPPPFNSQFSSHNQAVPPTPPFNSQFSSFSHNPPPTYPPYYPAFDHTTPPSPPYYPPFNQSLNPRPPTPPVPRPTNSHLPTVPMTHPPRFPHHSSPQQYHPGPEVQNGRKKAVICGISYKGMTEELKGCINDAKCMKYLLIQKFNFPESNIRMLTEEETSLCNIPTKRNIQSALRWLVEGSRPGDSLVFHYSGHGSQQKDTDGDEIDGLDETICPLDYHQSGMIVDDWINETIVRPLLPGVKLHAIVDSCHSGTVLDLPYLCRMNRSGKYEWEDHRPRTGVHKGTRGGEVYSFSGCDDDQSSADTDALSKTTSTGAMTFAFIQAIERGEGRTYGSLLNSMRSVIRNVGDARSVGFVTQVIGMLLAERPVSHVGPQEPQLTSNEAFDVYTKPFSL